MSKFVLVSDIHSNAKALEAVLQAEGTDAEYIVLGDIVGLNAYPAKTVELVQELDGITLAGNHDKAIFHEGVGHVNSAKLSEFELSHTINSLSHEQIDYMQELPFIEVVENNATICAAHAKPWPGEASGYEMGNAGVTKGDVPTVAATVSDDYDYVFLGHTHEQYDIDMSKWGHDVIFVNPGSLGYNGTYSVVDTNTGTVESKSVKYDKENVKEHIQSLLPEGAPHTNKWFQL